jgi:hypothetical protein
MPEQANFCSLLVEFKREILVIRMDENVQKDDLCDIVDTRIAQIVKQIISTPYCNNFCFDIDKPPELDVFDRAALHHMEQIDTVSTSM